MNKKVVIGLGYGDEGKAHVVEWLANYNSLVVRYSGGHNAGHCVVVGKNKHIFSNFGSATLNGVGTVWDANTFDPVGFCNEYKEIYEDFDISPNIKINPKTPVTTPWDKLWNLKREEEKQHSTIGVGFGATIQREEDNYHLLFEDLYFEGVRDIKIEAIRRYYLDKGVRNLNNIELNKFLNSCVETKDLVVPFIFGENRIYESSQGLLLDMDYGFFPYVTRSQLGTQTLNVDKDTEYYLITRAYQTRHGNGPLNKELFTPLEVAHKETNVYNDHQGAFKSRALDIDMLKYAILVDENIQYSSHKNLVITCLDHMTEYVLTHEGKKKTFSSESLFLDYIIRNLPSLESVYVSHGPEKHNIKRYLRYV